MGRDLINFAVGILLGTIAVPFYNYNRFLYYTVFCVQIIIIYILINGIKWE